MDRLSFSLVFTTLCGTCVVVLVSSTSVVIVTTLKLAEWGHTVRTLDLKPTIQAHYVVTFYCTSIFTQVLRKIRLACDSRIDHDSESSAKDLHQPLPKASRYLLKCLCKAAEIVWGGCMGRIPQVYVWFRCFQNGRRNLDSDEHFKRTKLAELTTTSQTYMQLWKEVDESPSAKIQSMCRLGTCSI